MRNGNRCGSVMRTTEGCWALTSRTSVDSPNSSPKAARAGDEIQLARSNFKHGWTRINLSRLTPQPQFLDCGGKRSATPLLEATGSMESCVAAALCHRSPNLCRPCAKLQDCITDEHGFFKPNSEIEKGARQWRACSPTSEFGFNRSKRS